MIISASRRTDIPYLYGDWLISRIKAGSVKVRNPQLYNQVREVSLSPENIHCYVLWTKYPASLIKHYPYLKENNIPCYFHFTVNGYGTTLEPNVPPLEEVLKVFKETSKVFGERAVIWRYDPIIILPDKGIDYHLERFTYIAKALKTYTARCVTSFFDPYPHCERNEVLAGRIELSNDDKISLLKKMLKIARSQSILLNTCAEAEILEASEVENVPCVDPYLIEALFNRTCPKGKDRSQPPSCKCIRSIDIGEYNSCTMGCSYCYATRNLALSKSNLINNHLDSPFLAGWDSIDDLGHKLTR